MKREPEHIDWCNYCHSEILDNEDYIVKNGRMYHLDCWKQMHTTYDEIDGLTLPEE